MPSLTDNLLSRIKNGPGPTSAVALECANATLRGKIPRSRVRVLSAAVREKMKEHPGAFAAGIVIELSERIEKSDAFSLLAAAADCWFAAKYGLMPPHYKEALLKNVQERIGHLQKQNPAPHVLKALPPVIQHLFSDDLSGLFPANIATFASWPCTRFTSQLHLDIADETATAKSVESALSAWDRLTEARWVGVLGIPRAKMPRLTGERM